MTEQQAATEIDHARRELLADLLQRTSRTFALAIPLLPDDAQREVGLGYLLFRIADTLEDAERFARDRRIAELKRFVALLESPDVAAAERLASDWSSQPPSTNEDYNRLMRHAGEVFAELLEIDSLQQGILRKHAARSARGMADTLRRADESGSLRLESLDDLRAYCYHVAGIVGEMLTELFRTRLAPSNAAAALEQDARSFGEALQLVNILKDAPDDARDGRVYLPQSVPRSEVFALARQDLQASARYSRNLREAGAEPGVVAFAELPRRLAEATLDTLESGDARKLARTDVLALLAEIEQTIASERGLS